MLSLKVTNGQIMKTHKLVSKIHKWVGLLIGIQFLFWTAGGVVMTWLPIESVRGEHHMAASDPVSLSPEIVSKIIAHSSVSALQSATVRRVGPVDVLELRNGEGLISLIAADSGELLEIGPQLAQAVAEQDFTGTTGVVTAALIHEAPGDFGGKLPVWQVGMGDADGTRIYVSADNGRVLARRNDTWRFYDFFWMLHIMDYESRDNFNNPLVMTAGATGLLFVLSGLILVFYRFGRRDFGLARKR